jgi:hypothetical protein
LHLPAERYVVGTWGDTRRSSNDCERLFPTGPRSVRPISSAPGPGTRRNRTATSTSQSISTTLPSMSTRTQWFSEWSRGCERQLNALRPREFPLADEIRAEPVHSPSPLAVPGLVRP